MTRLFILFAAAMTLYSCRQAEQKILAAPSTDIRYAKGFNVRKDGDVTWITVTYPYQDAKAGITYLLVPKDATVPDHSADVQVIRTPIETIVCTATTHLPHLVALGLSDKLIGFPSTEYVSSTEIRKRIDAGQVRELGIDHDMNVELLYSLKPELVMGYVMSADFGSLKKVMDLGTPVVINAEYLERDPLGRAEWIKFTSQFFNKQKEADSVFNFIEQEYLSTRDKILSVDSRPSVLSGVVYNDAWFMPGGQNYASRILKDAGCNYLWAADSTHGYLKISFESVYEKAKDADLWIGVGSIGSLDELGNADGRYKMFKAFTTGNVYSYNARVTPTGGNDFLENGYLRPDIILKDLGKIAHPDLFPDHQLYFHTKLN